jgi:hypothetical protein
MKLTEDMRVDAQSIGMLKDKETDRFVDYFFLANLWCKDPRYESCHMQAGECRGLFRFYKNTLDVELLLPMPGDDSGTRFGKAARKVLKEYRANGEWPKCTQYASG